MKNANIVDDEEIVIEAAVRLRGRSIQLAQLNRKLWKWFKLCICRFFFLCNLMMRNKWSTCVHYLAQWKLPINTYCAIRWRSCVFQVPRTIQHIFFRSLFAFFFLFEPKHTVNIGLHSISTYLNIFLLNVYCKSFKYRFVTPIIGQSFFSDLLSPISYEMVFLLVGISLPCSSSIERDEDWEKRKKTRVHDFTYFSNDIVGLQQTFHSWPFGCHVIRVNSLFDLSWNCQMSDCVHEHRKARSDVWFFSFPFVFPLFCSLFFDVSRLQTYITTNFSAFFFVQHPYFCLLFRPVCCSCWSS